MDMDIDMSSPMARKAPRVVQVEIQAPTPLSGDHDMMVDSPVTIEEEPALKPVVE